MLRPPVRSRGRVVRQRSAKAPTAVQIRSRPLLATAQQDPNSTLKNKTTHKLEKNTFQLKFYFYFRSINKYEARKDDNRSTPRVFNSRPMLAQYIRQLPFLSTYLSKALAFLLFTLVLSAQDVDSIATKSEVPTQDAALVEAGATLFKGNCTVCHQIDEKLIGPPLRDLHKRRPITWIKSFIKNSQQVIESGDEYALSLYKEYNQTQMTAFDFSDEELNSLIAYIISESEQPISTATTTSSSEETASSSTAVISSTEVQLIWAAIIAVLLLILLVLGVMTAVLKNYALQKDTLSEEDKARVSPKESALRRVLKSKAFMGFVVFFFVAIVVKTTLDGLFSIGLQQGYAPEQPIAFSHKIHAGEFNIDCNYCHTSVYKSKSANIPSANICMNCHGEIKKESPEIQKIYTAIENNRPIEWIRVHNLPDLSYFNHSQHVTVGKISCETCHGDIKNMDVVAQHAELTMGWCINCHKETQLQAQDNAYYDKFTQIHNSKQPLRVEDIGGLECSKCHY